MSPMSASTRRFHATQMRRNPTRAESLLYNALLSAFEPFDAIVKCQEPIGYYIADFMIYPARVVVEVDGKYHTTVKARDYDARRDSTMKNVGIRIHRVTNTQVLSNAAAVARAVVELCAPSPRFSKDLSAVQVIQYPPAFASDLKRSKPRKLTRRSLEAKIFGNNLS